VKADYARRMGALLSDAYLRPNPRATDGPLVTVVIATYNRSEVLGFAIESAVRQTYRRLEILVVGDACTDDSEQVVASLGDPRVKWMNLEENSGSQSGPNNAGLRAAGGELIAYLGHDDLWRPDHVALLVADLQLREADVSSTIVSSVWPRPLPVRRVWSPPLGEFVPPSCLMHTLAAARAAGEWRDYRDIVRPPDFDFVERLGQSGARFSRVRALSVIKFPSAVRTDSYLEHRSAEQAAFSRRIGRRSFVAREALTAMALYPLQSFARSPALDPSASTRPGGLVSEWRRVRGLDGPPAGE
jgi:glycosyltransferase involved in cell wall biosynthesis